MVGVDPIGSLYYEYVKTGRMTKPFATTSRASARTSCPSTMNLKIVDEIVRVDDKECFLMTRELVRQEGLFCGGSCGAAVAGAIKYAESRASSKENILVLLPDGGAEVPVEDLRRRVDARERLPRRGGSARHGARHAARSKTRRAAHHARKRGETVREVIALMKEHGISQVPVLDGRAAGRAWSREIDLLELPGARARGGSTRRSTTLVESRLRDGDAARRKIELLSNIFNDAKLVVRPRARRPGRRHHEDRSHRVPGRRRPDEARKR